MLPGEFKIFFKEVGKLLFDLQAAADASQAEEIERFQEIFNDIIENETLDDSVIRGLFWTDFEAFCRQEEQEEGNRNELTTLARAIQRQPFTIAWGFWGFINEEPLPHGYSDKHVHMLQGPQNPSGRHTYLGRPEPIKIDLEAVMDGDIVRFYTASVPINCIDAISSVPSIRDGISPRESSSRVLDPSSAQDEWQRGLMTKRIVSISSFVDSEANSFANSCMLFERPSPDNHVRWIRDARGIATQVEVDFDFLQKDPVRGGKYLTDHTRMNIDLRPMSIIDGQHRVRGGMRSARGHNLEIPVVLFPEGAGNQDAAKFFAEINTLSEPLKKLHEIFMRHKFSLPSHKPEMKYGAYDGTKNTHRDRANRLAYETAASVNLSEGPQGEAYGAMTNLIRILTENPGNNYVFTADMWVKLTYQWFMPNGPYPPTPDPTEPLEKRGQYFKEVSNYFEAFRRICNKDWGDDMKRWLDHSELPRDNRNGDKPLIQNSTSARSLLLIYPRVHAQVRRSGFRGSIIPIERFEQAMSSLANIDWLHPTFAKDNYAGTAEGPWKSLCRWMMDALRRGEVEAHSTDEIHSDGIASERGKGLLSEIEEGEMVFDPPNHTWPTPEQPVTIRARRPINARRTCTGYLRYENKKRVDSKKYKCTVRRTAAEALEGEDDWESRDRMVAYTIHHHSSFDTQSELEFELTWSNIMGEVNSFIKLTR